jgi:UrcA family protein
MTSSFALIRSTLGFTVAATATMLIVAGSAAPAGATDAPRLTIDTSGIDLASPAGVARVEKAIGRAARSVCAADNDRTAAAALARHQCIKAALAAAMPRFNQLAASARDARLAVADAAPAAPVRR